MAPNIASAGAPVAGACFVGARFAAVGGAAPAGVGVSVGWSPSVGRGTSPGSGTTGAATGGTEGRTDVERGIVERGFVGRGLVALAGVVAGVAETESAEGPIDALVDASAVPSGAAVPVGESSTSFDGAAGAFGCVAPVVPGRAVVARGFVVRGVVVRGVPGFAVEDFAAAGLAAAGFAAAAPVRDAAEVREEAGFRVRGVPVAGVAAGVSSASESSPEGGAADAPAGFSSGSESTCQPYQCRPGCLCENWASHHELGT